MNFLNSIMYVVMILKVRKTEEGGVELCLLFLRFLLLKSLIRSR